jgi:hypothetical protein
MKTRNASRDQLTSQVFKFKISYSLGCKPTSWFHSQGNQPQCPLPEVTSEDPLKDVPAKKIVDDGSVPKQAAVQRDEPDAEKELIRKVIYPKFPNILETRPIVKA